MSPTLEPNTNPSSKLVEANRLPPCKPVRDASPAAYKLQYLRLLFLLFAVVVTRPSRSVITPPQV
jgi:hypothetical protein